jgi:hypothetical protein
MPLAIAAPPGVNDLSRSHGSACAIEIDWMVASARFAIAHVSVSASTASIAAPELQRHPAAQSC